MVKSALIIVSLFSFLGDLKAQEVGGQEWIGARRPAPDPSYIQPGMIAASATFSPGIMLNRSATNYYLSGFAEYHLDRRLSFRSDNYFFLSTPEEDPIVRDAFRSYFGAFYHFRPDGYTNWDKYIGFQPGLTYMVKNPYYGDIQYFGIPEGQESLSASFAITAGTSFYVWKYFHFFANLTYVNSKISGVPNGPFKTDELLISAGLGFQVNTKKQKGTKL